MRFMADGEELADRIRDLVAGEKGLSEQRMFGGAVSVRAGTWDARPLGTRALWTDRSHRATELTRTAATSDNHR
jgi:hypothetical protein